MVPSVVKSRQMGERKNAAFPTHTSLRGGLPREGISLHVMLDRELSKSRHQKSGAGNVTGFVAVQTRHERYVLGKLLLNSDEKTKDRLKTGCQNHCSWRKRNFSKILCCLSLCPQYFFFPDKA